MVELVYENISNYENEQLFNKIKESYDDLLNSKLEENGTLKDFLYSKKGYFANNPNIACVSYLEPKFDSKIKISVLKL